MPKLQFSDILNKDKGKTGFVLGLGASLRNNLEMLRELHHDKDNYKIVSCNNIDILTDINFDYWILAQPADESNPLCIRNAHQRYNARLDRVFLYTDCLDLTDKQFVVDRLKVNYIGYDQRHWGSEACTWGTGINGQSSCCERIIKGRLCIQEEFMKHCGVNYHYGAGDTVGVHMVALAVMLGLNPIYVTGIDLDYTQGYVRNDFDTADYRINMGIQSMNNSPVMVARVIEDLKIIKQAAENIGTQIYDLDGTGKLTAVFEHKRPTQIINHHGKTD